MKLQQNHAYMQEKEAIVDAYIADVNAISELTEKAGYSGLDGPYTLEKRQRFDRFKAEIAALDEKYRQ